MIPRRILTVLVFSLPVLVVAFGVLMGGFILAQATLDAAGAKVLRWVAVSALMLTIADVVLLVGALGINALGDRDDRSDSSGG
ncbi:MAG: hypothetical protein H8E44_14250 [Planctomycetes bacterium]|nr:hypothetical protein [Planctomycetota bacterium]MBL7038044.1 hypothetical protein [Pirellulaceae bacterium]